MGIQKEIDKLKVKAGYDGKPQQWQFGFDLACRELAKAQAVPDGFVLVPKEPTSEMLYRGYAAPDNLSAKYKAMIEAAQEPAK